MSEESKDVFALNDVEIGIKEPELNHVKKKNQRMIVFLDECSMKDIFIACRDLKLSCGKQIALSDTL